MAQLDDGGRVAQPGRWESLFGQQFAALLVFAYLVLDDVSPLPPEQLFPFRDRLYGFVGIRPHHYLALGRVISPKWNTLAVPGYQFRQLARPVDDFFAASPNCGQRIGRVTSSQGNGITNLRSSCFWDQRD